jgi:hypothetical protein
LSLSRQSLAMSLPHVITPYLSSPTISPSISSSVSPPDSPSLSISLSLY